MDFDYNDSMKRLFFILSLALINTGKAECPYVVRDQAEVAKDLAKSIEQIIQKDAAPKISIANCEKIGGQILRHYLELGHSYQTAYRQYRIDHFTKLFKGSEDDKKMKIMVRLAQDMGGKELIEKYVKSEQQLEQARSASNQQIYYDKMDARDVVQTETENQITSRYKALLRNMKAHPPANGVPFTFVPKIDCMTREISDEVLPRMISNDTHVDLSNYCIRYAYDYAEYPKRMSRIMIKVEDGRVEIWNCDQILNTEWIPPRPRKSDGHYKVDGTANCLGYDVVSGRYLDHFSLYGHDDSRLTFTDRMEQYYLQKGFDKTDPVKTLPQFLAFMRQTPVTFDQFYDLNIPSQCKFWKSIKEHYRNLSQISYQR